MAVLPKHWWAGREFDKPLTDPPLGSGPYRVGQFRVRPHPVDGARARRLVEGSADRRADWPISTPGAPNISATRRWRWRRSRPARSISASENIAKEWATAYDFPGGAEGAGEEGAAAPPPADGHAGLRHEHAPAAVQGCPGAPRAGDGVRFRMGQRQPVLWRLHPHQQLFQQQRPRLERHSRGRRAGVAGTSIATSCRRTCSPSRSSCR